MGEALSFGEGMDGVELAQDAEPTVAASPATDGGDDEPSEGVLLAQLIQLLSQRPQHSLLLSDLGALVPLGARQRVKDHGGLRSWLQQNTSLFVVSGAPGQESVSLAPGSDALTQTLARMQIPAAQTPSASAAPAPASNPPAAAAAAAAATAATAPFDEEVDGPSSLQLRGLPYRATVQDVRAFLGEHQALLADCGSDSAIHLLHNRDGRPSGFARVRLISPEAAQSCRDDLHLHSMDDRYVEVFVYSERPGKGRQRQRSGEEAAAAGGAAAPAKDAKGAEAAATTKALTSSADSTDSGPRSLCLAEAAGVTREQVVRECRTIMVQQPKRRMLLSMLGVALSPGARAYLKQMDQGLKHFLRLFPSEFVVEGGKGCEHVIYTPLQLSEALDFDGSRERAAAPAPPAAPSAVEVDLFPPCSPTPKKSEDVRISTGTPAIGQSGAGHHIATPSDWGTPAIPQPGAAPQPPFGGAANPFPQGPTPWLPPWPAMPGMTQPDASSMPQGTAAANAAATGPNTNWANAGAWAMPQFWSGAPGWPAAPVPAWPSTTPGQDAGPPPSLPLSFAFPGAMTADCGRAPAPEVSLMNACVNPAGGAPTPATTTPSSNTNSGHSTPPSAGGASAGAAASVRLRGLPFSATEQDVFNFFGQHDVVDRISEDPKAVNLLCRANGRPSGQALVQMRCRADAELARRILGGKWMGSRYIEVFLHGEDGSLEGMGNGGAAPNGDRPPSAGSSEEERNRRREAAQQAEAMEKAAAQAAEATAAAQSQTLNGAWAAQQRTQAQAPVAQLWQMSCMAAMAGQAPGPAPPVQAAMPNMGGGADESSWEALFHFLGREGMAAMASGMGVPATGAAPVGGG